MSDLWIGGSDGEIRQTNIAPPLPTGVVYKERTTEGVMPARTSVVPILNKAALKAHHDAIGGARMAALTKMRAHGPSLLAEWVETFRESALDPELKPEDCVWVSIHGHPVCIHPKKGTTVVQTPEGQKVFNKVQHDLIESALGHDAAWIADHIAAAQASIDKAKAAKAALQAKGKLTADEQKQMVSLNAAISRGGQDREALMYALAVKHGDIKSPEQEAAEKKSAVEAQAAKDAETQQMVYDGTLEGLNKGQTTADGVAKYIEILQESPVKVAMQAALDAYVKAQAVTAVPLAAAKLPGVGLNKPQMELYNKTMAGLNGGKIGVDDVAAKVKSLQATIVAAQKANDVTDDAKEKASLGAKISRSNQEIAALTAAVNAFGGTTEPAFDKAIGPVVAGATATASDPVVVDISYTDTLNKLKSGSLTSSKVDANIAGLNPATDSYIGMKKALDEFMANPVVMPQPTTSSSDASDAYHSTLDNLKSGKLSIGDVQSTIDASHNDVLANAWTQALTDYVEGKEVSVPAPHSAEYTSVYDSIKGWLADGTTTAANVQAGIDSGTLSADSKAAMVDALAYWKAGYQTPLAVGLPKGVSALYAQNYNKIKAALTSGTFTSETVQDIIDQLPDGDAKAGQQKALVDYTTGAQAKTPGAQLSAYHYKVYLNQLDDLANGKKSVLDTEEAVKYYEKIAAKNLAGTEESLKALGIAYAKAQALAVFQNQAIPAALKKATVLPAAGADVKPKAQPIKMGVVLAPDAHDTYTATLDAMKNGELTTEDALAIKKMYNDSGDVAGDGGDAVKAKAQFAQAEAVSHAIDVHQGLELPATSSAPKWTPSAPAPVSYAPATTPPAPAVPPSVPSAASAEVSAAFVPLKFESPKIDAPEAKVMVDPKLGTTLEYSKAAGGTQGAKWYKDSKTGDRWVVKSYTDPDRAATEIMANAVYRQMGIPAAESVLTEVNDKPVYATKEVKGAELGSTDFDKLGPAATAKFNQTMAQGFIVDALLGSRDVVGQDKDNIIVSPDGAANRIDVGGTMFYRAQGEKKDFPAKVEELNTLLTAGTAGGVYAGTGLDEYTKQQAALSLAPRLTNDWINAQVDKAGFSQGMAKQVKESLAARRDYIVNRYRPVEQVTSKTLDAVQEMNRQGHGVSIGGTAFKGSTAQANFEIAPDGKTKQLVLYGKLRTAAEAVVWQKFAPLIAKGGYEKTASGGQTKEGYVDAYHQVIMKTAKTFNHHMESQEGKPPDYAFNKQTLAEYQGAVSGMDPNGMEYQHHKAVIDVINANIAKVNAGKGTEAVHVPLVSATPEPPPVPEVVKPKPKGPTVSDIHVNLISSGSGAWERKTDPSTGLVQRLKWENAPLQSSVGTGIHFETPEVEGVYFPSGSKPGINENPYSRQGFIEVRAKDGSQASLRAGMTRLGIPNHDSTARDSEEAYLSRMAWWLKEDNNAAYVKATTVADDESRLLAKRQALSEIIGIKDVTALPEYNPIPKHDARGTSYYDAPVIKGVTDKMPESLWHHLYSNKWSVTTGSMLNSGVHSLESTEQRLKKGLFISGMSSNEDQKTGGAGHLFFYFGGTHDQGTMVVDGRIMRRLDSFAHTDDQYGNLKDKIDQRIKPQKFSGHNGAWQATIAGGVGFDYVKEIHTGSEDPQKIIANFKKMGITHMGQYYKPGGIPIEQIISAY